MKKKTPVAAGIKRTHKSASIIALESSLMQYVIPLKAGGKTPGKKGTWKKAFSREDFPEKSNYGLRLGEKTFFGYLTVIDFDGSEHFADFQAVLREQGISTDTITVKTGGKHNGYHLYYWTDKPFNGRFKGKYNNIDVEILGTGTYAVIPPSKVYKDYQIDQTNENTTTVENFVEHIKSAKEIPQKYLQDLQDLLKKTVSLPSNSNNASYLVNFSSLGLISSDSSLWEKVLNSQFESFYGVPLSLLKSHGFKCVFHKEANPSATLFWIEGKGKFVYHDFHNGKSFDIVEVFQALKHQKEPEFLPAVNSRKWLDGLLELFEWIDENGITTGFGERFDRWRSDFLERLILTGGGEFKNYIVDTLKVILEISRERINKGINELVLSKRFVADRVPWKGSDKTKAFIVNRAMNFLVFAGLLKKGRDLATGAGRTYIFTINFDCKASDVIKAWTELVKVSLSNYRDFNKSNVADLFGAKLANEIFKASAFEKSKLPETPVSKKVVAKTKNEETRSYADLFRPWGGFHEKPPLNAPGCKISPGP